ncbi:tRNA A64-2'-O-ribosylphosphate transferase, partial [Tremellales sp. Uapishka_1]
MSDEKAIRKHSAQHDLFNRIHSIAADEAFVRKVSERWFNRRFEVVANQRCGTWYCDPSTSSSVYAYFKSTDGHTLNWSFNLRRSNLSLAAHAEEQGGFIIVDSTRRGKRMPDGLSKTVPMWCAVINLALKIRRSRSPSTSEQRWDTDLYLPPQIVSPSEKAQIEARLRGWAEALEESTLPLPDLKKPLRPFFIHPSTSYPPTIPSDPLYTPIICLSASRWINGGEGDDVPSVTSIPGGGWFGGSQTVGFEYVPGAGDDDELWGRGLKPTMFHCNKEKLLATTREDLPDTVDELIMESKVAGLDRALADVDLSSTPSPLIGVPDSSSLLALDIGAPISSTALWSLEPSITIYVIPCEKPAPELQYITHHRDKTSILFLCPSAKTHPNQYARALKSLVDAYRPHSRTPLVLRPGSLKHLDPEIDVSILDPISPRQEHRKLLIPLAVLLLADGEGVTKLDIADRLHALITLWPDGNPPRAALRRVNEVLMSG